MKSYVQHVGFDVSANDCCSCNNYKQNVYNHSKISEVTGEGSCGTSSPGRCHTGAQKAVQLHETLALIVERRSAANQMERRRMRRLNTALSLLRDKIPVILRGTKRCTKIKTLKLAIDYIRYLQKLLAVEHTRPQNRVYRGRPEH